MPTIPFRKRTYFDLQPEYQLWFDCLPESTLNALNLRIIDRGQTLEAIYDWGSRYYENRSVPRRPERMDHAGVREAFELVEQESLRRFNDANAVTLDDTGDEQSGRRITLDHKTHRYYANK